MAIKKELRANNESPNGRESISSVDLAPAVLEPRIRIVIDFMKNNLDKQITVIDLARVAGLSTSRIAHLFTIEIGLPPKEYLRRLRMEKARQLLATSILSVKQVMGEAGYRTKSLFWLHFKESFGVSPSEYRKARRGTDKRSPDGGIAG